MASAMAEAVKALVRVVGMAVETAVGMAAREVVVRAMAPAHQQFCHVGRGGAWAVGTAGTCTSQEIAAASRFARRGLINVCERLHPLYFRLSIFLTSLLMRKRGWWVSRAGGTATPKTGEPARPFAKLFAAAGQVRGYMEVKLCPVAQIEGLLL